MLPPCSPCLRGESFLRFIHHGDTENTEGNKNWDYQISYSWRDKQTNQEIGKQEPN
jgi:hypothetical protein